MREFKNGVKSFAKDLNFMINSLLLFVVYLLGVGVTSIVAKLSGKRFLKQKSGETYWSELKFDSRDIDDYYSQF